ncbi:MAG: biotin/lipoyl-containing protein [Gemmatimonadales bacterium]
MRYTVSVGAKVFEVELDGDVVRVDGCEIAAAMIAAPGVPIHRLVIDRAATIVAITRGESAWSVALGGTTHSVTVEDDAACLLREVTPAGSRGAKGGVITAPMPGLVLRVEVEEGQPVEVGAGIVVLEAMKMENEIKSPSSGTVDSIHVVPGQAVQKGAVLAVVKIEA